jgi:hypothetical protein
LLDSNGNSKWQFYSSGGNDNEGNLILYKALDNSTDMVIATSGMGSNLGYTRIISSSFSPSLSVELSESKTYRDTSLSINKCLRGLFIIDKNNIISLI